jgi:carbamoyltransferase
MIIIGISCFYHDSAACIIKDGKLIAAAEEERFTRKKHDNSFPVNAIKFCLKEAKIPFRKMEQHVDVVGFYEKPMIKFERILESHLQMWPLSFNSFFQAIPSWMTQKLRIPKLLKKEFKYKGDVMYIDHHMSHAAASYLVSPYKEAAIVTLDGVGEWTTTAYGYAKGNDIELQKDVEFPSSLGLIYSAITAFLGFKVNNDEYKVMGLSPYGKPIYVDKLRKLLDLKEDGSFRLNMEYFKFHYGTSMLSKKFIEEFGPIRKRDEEVTQKHKDYSASLQRLTEEIILKILNHVQKETGSENLCLGGGVGLNSVANGKILRNTGFKNIYMNPSSGDAGGAIGVAYYIYNTVFGKPRNYVLKDAFLGPSFTNAQIKTYLDKNKINYKEFKSRDDLLKTTAKLIYESNVIGWFQGKMEWGPRALGSRSILSNSTNPKMKDIINLKVKHREQFRPFAPVVCVDDALKYFDCDDPIPSPTDYMLMVYPIFEKYHKKIPAVTHVDGSGRLQSIRREQNSLYYDLIKEFGKLSDIPILINTSFNIRGEPIVLSPHNAYMCMMGTGIDYLIVGNFIVARADNPNDMWDSEAEMNKLIKKGITN